MNEYYENFIKLWNQCGGLITQAEASRILRKSDGRIAQMIKEGKIKKIGQYVSFSQICSIAENEKKRTENSEEQPANN